MKLWMLVAQCFLAFAIQAESLSQLKAEGFGFADANRFPESQARLLATRAARVDAQRNLLETINGVRVTAGTTVKDMALESDIIGTRVKGMLQGAFEIKSDVKREDDSWIASMTMAVCLAQDDGDCRGRTTLSSVTQPNLKGAPVEERFSAQDVAAADQSTGGSAHSGLIVDASSLNFSPMLDVRLKTAAGKELYGPGHVPMGSEWLHWAATLDSAQSMADVVGENSLIVTPTGLGEASELVISDQDAISIFTSNTLSGDYLAGGKVIIVVSGS